MSRAAVVVDVQPVRLIADNDRFRAESFKNALCHHPRASVCAVKADAHTLIRMGCKADKITDIAVASRRIVNGFSDITSGRKRNLRTFAVEITLNFIDNVLLHLFAVPVQQLNTVVEIGIMACAYHDAAIKIIGARDVRNTRRCCNMHKVRIRAARRQSRRQCALEHITRTPCVLADNNGTFMLPSVVCTQKTADFVGMFNIERFVCFASESVRAEIF